jgi:Kef-type K+ transport system membrane component KefB
MNAAFALACASVVSAALRGLPALPSISQIDPVAPVLLAIVFIIFAAMLGGLLMRRLGQPAVLGELLVGMIVANVAYALHSPMLTVLREGPIILTVVERAFTHALTLQQAAQQVLPASESSRRVIAILGSSRGVVAVTVYQFVDQLSRIAIVFLLFLVGLETSVRELRRVGSRSLGVAVVGVACSWIFGYLVIAWIEPGNGFAANLFIGGIFTATSVAISTRVFRDIHQTASPESRVVLGAAVMDDILGLIILAVASGLVATGIVNAVFVAGVALRAIVFLLASIGLGLWLAPWLLRRLGRFQIPSLYLLVGIGLAFVYAWVAARFGLATIIGAFAAGLVLEDCFKGQISERGALREILGQLETLIVPIYFVLIGMQVKLESFTNAGTLWVTAAFTLAAIAGKFVAGTVCIGRFRWMAVGVAMIPRGEVELIFASIGRSLGVVNDATFAAVVAVVMMTTFVAPPLLKLTLGAQPLKH